MKLLFLTCDPQAVRRQLAGETLQPEVRRALRDDVSTDEITPVAILSCYDQRLGQYAHTGLTCGGVQPIAKGTLAAAGVQVLVAGSRYGKGSSREHSPMAEQLAGVELVFARSFERIYRQNADNIGLLTSTNFELLARIEQGLVTSVRDLLPEILAEREALVASMVRAGGLLRWGRLNLASCAEFAPSDSRPQTLFEKIIQRHRVQVLGTPELPRRGDAVFVRTDWRFIHEYYTGMADTLLKAAYPEGYAVKQADRVVVFEDHTAYVNESPIHLEHGLVPGVLDMVAAQRRFASQHGLRYHRTLTEDEARLDVGDNVAGISHAVMAERYALPGQVVVGTDSHTPHSGALGCVAFGVGTTDMAQAFVSGAIRLTWPGGVRIDLHGRLRPGVTAKDVVLHLLASAYIRGGGGVGKVFEFAGDGVTGLSVDERSTLTNMTAEMGGLTGIVAPDAETTRFLRERRGVVFEVEDWMASDSDAMYDQVIVVDLATLEPMVARPGDPGQGVTLAQLGDRVRVDIAYGGSCTAGKREDFDHYHEVLAWAQERGMRFAAGVQVYLQYGTTAVRDHCVSRGYHNTFVAMGVRVLQPSCGACANCGPGASTRTDQVTVSAINRNFPGRSGPGQVWLASPYTVMASALAGYLCSWPELQVRH